MKKKKKSSRWQFVGIRKIQLTWTRWRGREVDSNAWLAKIRILVLTNNVVIVHPLLKMHFLEACIRAVLF